MDKIADTLIKELARLADDLAMNRTVNTETLFELTKAGEYPKEIVALAESFGMMLVKVEAREYRLEETLEELRRTNTLLEQAKKHLARENAGLKKTLGRQFTPTGVIGKSAAIRKVLGQVKRVADTPVNVLFTGETGTGKSLIAKTLHFMSERAQGPFVALNCTAIPENLVESELFGIEKGVATNVEAREGRIEQAHNGTLFLDEVGDMPITAQAKLLKVLDEREVTRVGGRKAKRVDIRIIAATNKDLKEAVEKGDFREDLYYRLNVVHLRIPSLRERREDVPLLLHAFLERHAKAFGRAGLRFAPGVVSLLQAYDWPGNVRELDNEVERAAALCYGEEITLPDLSDHVRA
jgi:DNA-binding NtrC family response regulator